ncbi:MAG: PAS sensor protein [Sulfuricurvum sp. GWF2_44_89]|uniref:PAS sensor protein n=1 Tax=Sulfuricurvum kujiense TaxID=148813 RepID=A0A2D3WBY6_9BACT|nr:MULTISPECIES: PAS domain-containing protein [Sulfuricurvum]OHD79308.1 MAG: PAS sensor protein [Sulfuricurvum sp. GWF2_44_89]OHD94166.1 MAG: PAS sensor protein [Sulfuricurvum sp. RIFOXYD12_FULL_44_77]OHD98447.1 MAG: PAS sensor protein [Sulfuricurvum sp. RIFOXYD2_FULL_44_160]DAB38822.1 MAG TPA: PAS sensor protein [Sulfuricurvum kujiense]
MQELTFGEHDIIVSKTDTQGKVTYGNELFLQLAGYQEHEIIGAPHNIVRHPDMPKLIFKHLWETIRSGREVNAYVINQAKNGDYYWVYANVTPSLDKNGRVAGYYSVRRKPSQKALAQVKPLYQRLVNAERSGGVVQSQKILDELLKNYGGRYDKFILSL